MWGQTVRSGVEIEFRVLAHGICDKGIYIKRIEELRGFIVTIKTIISILFYMIEVDNFFY